MLNMAAPGTLLFKRGQTGTDSDNDMWDDTVLIKAYDNAVKTIKAELQGSDDEQNAQDTKKKKTNKRKKKRQKKKRQWKSGDQCRATYTEDGVVYDADIISLNEEAGTCRVRYRGYGNEEEHKVTDLQTISGRKLRQNQATAASDVDIASFADSMEWTGEKPKTQKSKNPQDPSRNSSQPSFPWTGMPPFSFPFMSQPSFPQPGSSPFNSFPNPFNHQNNIPFMPPPPPPVEEDIVDSENEALCSMLMAWYMSGYHTGYYQGLKHSRHQTAPHSSQFR